MTNPNRSPAITIVLMLCLLAALLPAVPAQAQPGADAALLTPQSAHAFFDERIPAYLEQYHIAGATVAVVQEGEVIFSQGYGLADVAAGTPVDAATTLFRIGSLTKLFTWTAVMQLVAAGALDLDADINSYLDFTLPATYAEPITLRHLLTHTAGFENQNLGYAAASAAELEPAAQWLPAHIPARVRPPGVAAAYSNYGTALAGYIVERVSGLSYAEYIRQHILQPLAMQHTVLESDAASAAAADIAPGYSFAGGSWQKTAPPFFQVGPAGEISATAADMAQFLLAHLGQASNGTSLLDAATLAQMHATAYSAAPDWPEMNGMALGFFELSRHGERIIGHVGAAMPSFHSLAALLPARDSGFFVSFNSAGALPLTTGASAILLRDFADAFLPQPPAAPLSPPADFAQQAGNYTGSYRFAHYPGSSVTTLEKSAELLGGAVTLSAPGDGKLQLADGWGGKRFVAVDATHFRQVDGDDAIVFALDGAGQATAAYLSSRSSQLFERLPWYATPALGQIVLIVCLLLFLSLPLALGAAWLRRRDKAADDQPRAARLARALAVAAALLNLLFLLGYVGVMLLAPQSIAFGQVALLRGVLILPLLAALAAVASLPMLWLAWREHFWGVASRLHYTVTVVGLLAFVWFLNQWNLLGWRL